MNVDWTSMTKRLIGLNQLGFRIEQENGHRWIIKDTKACLLPENLTDPSVDVTKCYGSYLEALDWFDRYLVQQNHISLIEVFNSVNHYDDLGVIFGSGTQ